MKIAKAIEILSSHVIPLKTAQDHDFFDAIKLGIEALKRIEYLRYHGYQSVNITLTGETG